MGDFFRGTWRADADFPHDKTGQFVRPDAPFRNWVTASGEAGPSGASGFKAEPGRYHLIVSLACPWAHRTLIFRRLKSLESMISLSVVHWLLAERGWTFDPGPGVIPDPIFGAGELREFYVKARPDYSGRVTVPVLWDRKTSTIVNNESSEIIRMFNSAFDGVGAAEGDYYPTELRGEIDALNARVYATVNNGVEGAVEHADDLGRFVIDDRARLLVPQDRHGHASAEIGPRPDIEFAQGARAEDRIGDDAAAFVEGPAAVAQQPMDHRGRDHVFVALEPAEDEGAVGPGARERDNEMIAAGLGLEAAGAARPGFSARRHPVAERRVGPHEVACLVVREVALRAP